MTKQILAIILALATLVLLIAGLNMILSAPDRGKKAADAEMGLAAGLDVSAYLKEGDVKTGVYFYRMESSARSYQIAGAILAAAGVLGLLAVMRIWLRPAGDERKR